MKTNKYIKYGLAILAIAANVLTGSAAFTPVPVKGANTETDPGRIDLRIPIVVQPGEADEITYSATDWGNKLDGATANVRFGQFGLATLPVVSAGLEGEGVTPFTYPEVTGRYQFEHEVVFSAAANAKGKDEMVSRPEVIVAWYVGEGDHPENVYAYDRGDGVIVVEGDGYMKDFDGCGPWGTDIKGVIIEYGVRNVGANAFKDCTALTHVDLPETMVHLGDGAFAGDTALETIWSDAWNPPYFYGEPFAGVETDDVIVYVPSEAYDAYEYESEDWAPFWNHSQPDDGEFYFDVDSYEGVSRKVTVNGEVWYEGQEYFEKYIPYGSKVELTATIIDERYLFDDGSTVKTFTWDFLNKSVGVYSEIRPYGADWLVLQRALAGTPLDDLRDAVVYENADGTNVVKLLKDISTASQYDRTLVVTNAAVLDLAGHAVIYGNGYASVIGVGASYWEPVPAQQQQQQRLAENGLQEVGQIAWEEDVAYHDERRYLPAWLNIVDTVGDGRITKSSGSAKLANGGGLQAPMGQFYYGGGITVLAESTCVMEGGAITGCYGDKAGGVHNMGTFVLAGGEIAGNDSELPYFAANAAAVDELSSAFVEETAFGDGIVNESGATLVITAGKVRDGIYNVENNVVPVNQEIAVLDDKFAKVQELEAGVLSSFGPQAEPVGYVEPVVEISGGYFGENAALERAWIVEGHEVIPSDEFAGYNRQVIPTPPEVAAAREKAKEELEKKAGLDMTRSDEMDDLIEEAFEAIDTAYPKESVETTFAQYLPKVVDQYAKDNPGVPQTLAATGMLDLRSERALPYGEDIVEGITYSDTAWGDEQIPGDVAILQQNLETGKKMALAEGVRGASEGTELQLVGQDTPETGLGHKLFHSVRGTVLESFVTFFFSGFERGKPSNPWDAGEPNVVVYIDPETPTGPTLVIEGEGELYPNGSDVAWNDRRAEITEIFVASGVVLKASALAGYPNLERIVFEDPNYRLPREAMNDYEYWDDEEGWCWAPMTWPSDGVYVMAFNGRRKVTAFYDGDGGFDREDSLYYAWDYGFNPIVFSTVPADLINDFPWNTEFEPLTDDDGNLTGWMVTLQEDINGTLYLSDYLGYVVIDLNGYNIIGLEGEPDQWGGGKVSSGSPALFVRRTAESGDPLVVEFIDTNPDDTPDVVGGKGYDGNPASSGGPAIYFENDHRDGVKVIVGPNVTVKGGDAGTGLGEDVSAGTAASYCVPEALVEVIEGGNVEYGEEAEGGVTAWATCSLDMSMTLKQRKLLPQGVSYMGGGLWFWRRVGGKEGAASFDFGELPLALFAAEGGITSLNVEFAPNTIDVDTLKAPVNFGFRFSGYARGGKVIVKSEGTRKEHEEYKPLPVVVYENTTLRSVSGKSIFEIAGEYKMKEAGEPSIIVDPVRQVVVDPDNPFILRADAGAPAVPAEAGAAATEPVVIVWEDLAFTSGEESWTDRLGGAIRMEGGAMQVVNCTFRDCFAGDYGGAIFAFGLERDSFITGCSFENCYVDGMSGYGGAIYASSKVVGHAEVDARVRFTVNSSTFAGNAAVNGGAICTMRDANVDDLINEQPIELVINQSTFRDNAAEDDGGAIFAEGPVTVKGTPQGGTVPVVIDPEHMRPIVIGAVRNTVFSGNFAGGSGGAIAMDCVVGDWFVPAKLSVGEGAEFDHNLASNAYVRAFGGAIAHLQPGGTLEIYGAKFRDNTAVATGFNADRAYALGGAVYADEDATVSFEKTRFFGNWAASDSAYAYGGAAALWTGTTKITACSFDDNGVAATNEFFGGAIDFQETTAIVKDSTFRGSNVEAVDAYGAELAFTNCVIVGNGALNASDGEGTYSDIYVTDTAVDIAWTAYGTYYGEGSSPAGFDDAANHNLPESTADIYDPMPGAEPWLNPEGYVPAAALGLKQEATDINGVPYGSRFWGYSMGAYECHTHREMTEGIVVTVDPEEYAYTGLPIEPSSHVRVYDAIVGSNLVEGVDYTLDWANNVEPTDRAIVTVSGTERDYIFATDTNFWITAYYVDYYKDDATEPYDTQVIGSLSHSNVVATIAPPEGYAYDPLTSTPEGEVRRYDSDCEFPRNGQLTLVVHYREDESDDDVPDVYQKKMHLKVVNGWWNETLNGADKTYWVTLYGEDGKWSREGVGILGKNPTNVNESVVFPTAGERPFTDFAASGKWWYMYDPSEFSNVAEPAGLEVRSSSWPFVIFLYDRKSEAEGGRGGRGGRGGTGGSSALAEYKLRAGLKITKFNYTDGVSSGEARASVVDESTGETILDELLRRTKVNVLATESLEGGEWNVIGSPTTDGEGGWSASEGAAAETPAQMFYKLQLR